MDGHNDAVLMAQILGVSASASWMTAKGEWRPEQMQTVQVPTACICGHFPETDIFQMKNVINGSSVIVGKQCAERFQGQDPDPISGSFAWIYANPFDHSPREQAIEYAAQKGWLTGWEYDFLTTHCNDSASRLNGNQLFKRHEINTKLLDRWRWNH